MERNVFIEMYKYTDKILPKEASGGSEGDSVPKENIRTTTDTRTAGMTMRLTVPIPPTPFSDTKQAKTRNVRDKNGFACGKSEFKPESIPAQETNEPKRITAFTVFEKRPNIPFKAPSKPP
jgi:hypothetical protein